MKRQVIFSRFFNAGISFDKYLELTTNEKIMNRMSRHFEATKELISKIEPKKIARINQKMKVLCIAENWCGDCANGVPVISALAEILNNWEFVITVKAPFEEEFMRYYCTAGRQKIPVIIFADNDGDEISRWIERPTRSYLILAELQSQKLSKEEYSSKYRSIPEFKIPDLTEEILKELMDTADRATALKQILPTKNR